MGSSSCSLMGSPVESSPDFTATLQIILRSRSVSHGLSTAIDVSGQGPHRQHQEPRTVSLSALHHQAGRGAGFGKATDAQKCADVRQPTGKLFRVVKKARKAIYKGYKVSGTCVDKLLGGVSRAPNTVSTTAIPTSLEC